MVIVGQRSNNLINKIRKLKLATKDGRSFLCKQRTSKSHTESHTPILKGVYILFEMICTQKFTVLFDFLFFSVDNEFNSSYQTTGETLNFFNFEQRIKCIVQIQLQAD